ncbi:MAG: glycoside hydrolase family 16 protein [Bradyrhizobium sp.]
MTRRGLLGAGALAVVGFAESRSFPALAQTMPPMAKRDPTDAERQAVRDYHKRGAKVLFEDGFSSRAKFEENWTVFTDNRSDLKACRTAASLATSDKGLAINTIKAEQCIAPWSTGEIVSKQAFQYGLFEAYMQIAHGPGVDNAFWLTSERALTDGTGDTFEIDVAETYYPSLIRSTLHRHNLDKHLDRYETGNNNPVRENLANGFHDYGVLWTPSALIFCLDGEAFKTIETKGTVTGPANLRLSTALAAAFGGNPPADPRGLTMNVMHVRVLGL